MRTSPFLIGITVLLLAACHSQNPPEGFRQPTMSGSTATGDTVDAPNETTPKTADSLEVGGATSDALEVHALSGSILMGSPDATARITMYDDYDCFYCREFGSTDLEWALVTYAADKKLSVERVFVPSSPAAVLMTEAALCSEKQHLFAEADKALHSHPIATEKEIPALAKKVGLNLKSLQSCMASKAVATSLQAAADRAKNDGVTRFPSFELGTDRWIGILTREELQKKIGNAL